jgi:uncharacterized protein
MDMSKIFTANKKASSKFLATVFGYMFIGLLITAAVAFFGALAFAHFYYVDDTITDQGANVLLAMLLVSLGVLIVDQIVMSFTVFKTGKGVTVCYIIYALIMGVFLSTFLILGVDFATIGEALGLTALAFGIMFLIGYFSPVNLSPLAFVAMGLFIGVLIVSLFFGVWFLISPDSGAEILFDFGISIVFLIVIMLITGWDANNMSRIAEQGVVSSNLALYCAFTLYTDFIAIFVRILYLLLLSKSRR